MLSDISALGYGYKYDYKKSDLCKTTDHAHDHYLKIFISCPETDNIPCKEFEWIEEYHHENQYSWFIGVIKASKLFTGLWWMCPGISLILCAAPVIENIEYRKIHKKAFNWQA